MGIKSNYRSTIVSTWPDVLSVTSLCNYRNKSIAVDISGMLFFFTSYYGQDFWYQKMQELFMQHVVAGVDLIMVFDGKSGPEKIVEQRRRQVAKLGARNSVLKRLEILRDATTQLECCQVGGYDPSEDCLTLFKEYSSPNKINKNTIAAVLGEEYDDSSDGASIADMLYCFNGRIAALEKQLFHPGKDEMARCIELCNEFEWICVTAPSEADHVCAWLAIRQYVEAVLSEDSDMIALGCPKILTRMRKQAGKNVALKNAAGEWNWTLMNVEKLRELSGLDQQQLRHWAICCGTDYNCNMSKIGSINALKLIQTHGNLAAMEAAGVKTMELQQERHDATTSYWQHVDELFKVEKLDVDATCLEIASKIGNETLRLERIARRKTKRMIEDGFKKKNVLRNEFIAPEAAKRIKLMMESRKICA